MFLLCLFSRPKRNDTPIKTAYLEPSSWFLISFSNERSQGSLEKWPTLEPGYEISKMSSEHFVVLKK